jgi:hypothetical protein
MTDDLDGVGERAGADRAPATAGRAAPGHWPSGPDSAALVVAQLELMVGFDPRWHLLAPSPWGPTGRAEGIEPIGDGRLVVGPAGAFLVRVREMAGARVFVHGDSLWADGARLSDLDDCRRQAELVHRQLTAGWGRDVPVSPVLVPLDARELSIVAQPLRTQVIARPRLVSWLAARPERFADESVDAIHRLALERLALHPS